MAEWKPTCDRFIGLFDIMGFKDTVYRNDHAKVMEQMLAIRGIVTDIENIESKIRSIQGGGDIGGVDITSIKTIGLLGVVKPVIFSDSILLVSEDDTMDSAMSMLIISAYLIGSAFDKKIPIKGALAYGEQTADFGSSLYFGRPLVDAYMLESELNMYGAVLHHSMEKYLINKGMMQHPHIQALTCRCELPFKNCHVNHYCIDYSIILLSLSKNPAEAVLEMSYSVSGTTRSYVDNTLKVLNNLPTIKLVEKLKALVKDSVKDKPNSL